ncbi:MAG: T9SS C-terminal target domain-containing protein [Chitinophagaceae bacterium]|nr:MAG: T9SS C-terminal target domain-containing protein [Chitinophagaceae bacterium]
MIHNLFKVSFLLCFLVCIQPLKAQLFINEFLSSNHAGIEDMYGNNEDWIEIYNSGQSPVNLQGYYLSDDEDDKLMWSFPDTVIAPGSFLIVFASGHDIFESGEMHTNFRISIEGEPLFLSDPSGQQIDMVPAQNLLTDYSYGRYPDGAAQWYIMGNPSPEEPNNNQSNYTGILSPANVLTEGGFYQDSVEIQIAPAVTGSEIRYTTDGTEPDENSPLYTGPFKLYDRFGEPNQHSTIVTSTLGGWHGWDPPASEVFKAHNLRVKVFKPGYVPSEVVHTYFIDSTANMRYDLPVWSITTNHDNFFGQSEGLFIPQNYLNRGFEWEREAFIELFKDGQKVIGQHAGIRTHGGASRHYPQKTLRLYARNLYGNSHFEYPLFGDDHLTNDGRKQLNQFKRLLLRSSGNDWPMTLIRDAALQSLLEGIDIDKQAYTPSVAFINGEFWGIHNIRERQDRFYIATHYDLDPDSVVILKRDRNTGVYDLKEGEPGDEQHYIDMEAFIDNEDITDPVIYEQVKELMDVYNFIDFQIAHIFFANRDWPSNNNKYYRYKGAYDEDNDRTDGRWRWIVFDTDFSFGYSQTPPSHNTLVFATNDSHNSWPNASWATFLLRNLLDNESFKVAFINRFADHLNTRFKPSFVEARIDSFHNDLANVIDEHVNRWQRPFYWQGSTQNIIDFGNVRAGHVFNHIQNFFSLDEIHTVILDVDNPQRGSIKFSTLQHDEYPWTGDYFSNVPVLLKAIPEDGYEFVEWLETGDTLSEMYVYLDSDTQFTAVFEAKVAAFLPFTYPALHDVCDSDYVFDFWPPNAPALTYPQNIMFHTQDFTNTPDEQTEMVANYTCAYDLNNRPRINGLGVSGFSFINTGNPQNSETCLSENGWVGAAVLGLSTDACEDIELYFTAGTVQENSRTYNLRLQYKLSENDVWQDFEPFTEYTSSYTLHFQEFGPIPFPDYMENQDTVYLRWLYYQSPQSDDSGPRAQVRIDDIIVKLAEEPQDTIPDNDTVSVPEVVDYTNVTLYPNPGNNQFTIDLPFDDSYLIDVKNVLGQKMAETVFNGSRFVQNTANWPEGIYFIRIQHDADLPPLIFRWIK